MADMVNHPPHYNSHPSGIEFIEVGRHFNFNIGSAMKYLWRNGLKKELGYDQRRKQIEDLRKAIWYINDEIEQLEKQGQTDEQMLVTQLQQFQRHEPVHVAPGSEPFPTDEDDYAEQERINATAEVRATSWGRSRCGRTENGETFCKLAYGHPATMPHDYAVMPHVAADRA